MIDINNLTKEILIDLLKKVAKDDEYIFKNYSKEERIKLFEKIMLDEDNEFFYSVEKEYAKELYDFMFSILTHDELVDLKNSDEFKDKEDEIEYFEILTDSSQIIASKIFSSDISIDMIFLLKKQKRKEILEIIKNNMINLIDGEDNKKIFEGITNVETEEEFYSLIKKLDSKNILKLLGAYPDLFPLRRVVDSIEDDYKERMIDTTSGYDRKRLIESIKNEEQRYLLAIKYLDDSDIAEFIMSEEDEEHRFELFCKYYDKLSDYFISDVVDSFKVSLNMYNSIAFLYSKGMKLDSFDAMRIYRKLENEHLALLIPLICNDVNSYDLFELITRLDIDKKYEYMMKYNYIINYKITETINILLADFVNKRIDESKFVNLILNLLENKRKSLSIHDVLYVLDMVNDYNKYKIIDSLGSKLWGSEILDIIKELNVSAEEKLNLVIKYEIDTDYCNLLLSKLPVELRIEYLEKAISSIEYYKINLDDLKKILSGMDLKMQVNALEILISNEKLTKQDVANIDLSTESDEQILEMLNSVRFSWVKFSLIKNLKNDLIKYNLFEELYNYYIYDYNELVDIALDSIEDINIKIKFLVLVSNYRGSLEYTIDLLNKVNADLSYFEKIFNENQNSRDYELLNKAIMISKFDDKLKIKYFDKTNNAIDINFFSLLIKNIKFDDNSLDYTIFKESIRTLFFSKKFELFNDIDDNILKYFFSDTELYFFNERKQFDDEDKKILDTLLGDLKIEKIIYVVSIIKKVNNSNCLEVVRLKKELKDILLTEENAIYKLKVIEKIFLRNNLPLGAKLYQVHETLHPNFTNLRGIYSKVLTDEKIPASIKHKVLLEDMVRITFLSAPKQALDYLDEMQLQINLLKKVLYIKNRNIKYEELDEESRIVVNNILNIVNSWSFIFNFKRETDLSVIYEYLNEDMISGIEDWIVNIISNSLGVELKDISSAKQYVIHNAENVNERNKNNRDFTLKEGDLVKGVKYYEKYLYSMLQNGVNCQEFLGANASGDATNLDTDFSMISKSEDSIEKAMEGTTAENGYGKLWIVLKNRKDRFNVSGDPNSKQMELFETWGNNYGIRSGVPVTEIDYIICEDWNERIGFAIACSGIYIPIVNKKGELLFDYDDFEKMRSKMQGLSYYGSSEYKISSTLYRGTESTLNFLIEDAKEIERKRNIIYDELDHVVNLLGFNVVHNLDSDFTSDNMELIDTGSTSRGNNKPNDADFDFMFRMDSDTYNDEESRNEFVTCMEEKLKELGGTPNGGNNPPNRLRYKDVCFEGIEEPVEIDISFVQRTNRVEYTTDMCLIDRMNNIKEQYPELYNSVRLNVIIAKSILKKAGIYKRIDNCLGGIGSENWILQNGGSVIDAVNSFLDVANSCSSFAEFKQKYSIFDFGTNFYESSYTDGHDNFIYNLSEDNYKKMKEVLTEFKNDYEKALNNGTLDEYISELIGFEDLNLKNSKKL